MARKRGSSKKKRRKALEVVAEQGDLLAPPPPAGGERSESDRADAATEASEPKKAVVPAGAGESPGSVSPSASGSDADDAGEFRLVSEDVPDEPPPPPQGERLARAKELVQAGRVEDAQDLYRSILADNPKSLKARNNLGALFEALGQHHAALEQFEAAEQLDGENVEVLINLGSVLGLLGRYEEAEVLLGRASRLAPDDLEVRASLGILAFRRGLYAQAESELRWVCERDMDHGNAYFYRGEALNRLGRYEEALQALDRAIVLQPTNGRAFYTLGILYDRKHLPREASLMYRKAREFLRG